MDFIQVVDFLGTIAFAISGALAGINKKLDAFGVAIIAFVTAAGGGTLRDILLGVSPVSWMTNMNLVYTILVCVLVTFIFSKRLLKLRKTLFLFDTIGIGLYTVVGLEMGLVAGLHPLVCITLGCITACFGGVIRDILVNEIPVIFRKNIYATACIAGGSVYFILMEFQILENLIFVIAGSCVIAIRLLAVRFKWQLPRPYLPEDDEKTTF
ncbi:MAG: trimeric intracellular cation channel family protein [Nonlabens sp.]|uniref:trimeric intracellular cation channel family protein n=1 Tax=Nonlabens sp. TaxID=1888209 RepID=UPI003EFA448B